MKSLLNATKLLALCFVFSALAPSGFAAPTSKNDADKAIKSWLKTTERPLNTNLSKEIVDIKEYKNNEGVVLHYVVNMKPEGFVVMSADDLIEPVIAFSALGTFEPSNPLYEIVQIDLSDRLKKIKDLEAKAKAEKKEYTPSGVHKKSKTKWKQLIDDAVPVGAPIDEKTSDPVVETAPPDSIDDLRVDALVKSQWSQGSEGGSPCYNYYTPSNCVSGCMATAYAQVMRYHQYPTTGVAVVTRNLSANGVTTPCTTRGGNGSGGPYDWANMPLDPDASITLVQRQAIGALMSDAGIFLWMNYTDGLSTSGFGGDALIADFHYANAVDSSNTHDYTTTGEFHKILNTNLDAGYPTMLAINGSAGGHAIVCDGYGFNLSTPYHHLNMGWGGGSNGWYNMPNITASYNDVFAVTYNIFPTGNGEIISGRVINQLGNPEIGITITATEGANTYTDVTDSKGIYGIRVPSNKTFTLTCPYTIGATVTTGFSADSTGNRIQNFTLSSGPELFFSHTAFLETPGARGTIANPMVINIISETFTGADGADVSANVSVANIPVGLSAQFIKNSATQLTCTLTGYAPYHTEADDKANLTFTFQNSAFTGGNASAIRHYNKSNFAVDFNNYLYYENFDDAATFPANMTDQWIAGSTSLRWKVQTGGKTGGVYPAAAHSAPYNATLYLQNTGTNTRRMITPSFNTLGYNNLTFKFWHNQQNWGTQDTLKVLYSLDDGVTWIQLQEYLTSIMHWTEETFTLPTSSATTRIAFEGTARYGFGVNIDDISVLGTPTGEPILQEMQVARGTTAVADGGTDTITPTEGGVGAPVTYKISNIGGLNLTLTTPVTIDSFSNCSVVVNTQPSSTVVPGTFSNLVLTVTPTVDGPWSANVSIANNDSNENPYNWQIRGTALTTYTVTLNKDGGTGGSSTVEAAFGAAMPAATAPTKAGYVFGGYYSQLAGAGIQYYTNTMASARTWDLTANTTLYAKWTVGTYTVTFNANGGTTSVPTSKTVTFGGTYGILATTSRVGYNFNGWWTATSGGSQVQTTTTVTNGANHQIYARWVGTDPQMEVARGASSVSDGGTDTVTVTAAGVATPLTYTISSVGTANITPSAAIKATETNCTVSITTQPAASVAPASSTNLVLTVTPTAGGPWSFALSIANNDPNNNPYNWSVGGMAMFDATGDFQQNNLPHNAYTGVTDTYLDANTSTTNYGTNASLALNNRSGKERQSLVRFDLSSIPVGSTVKSATLQFTENGSGAAGSVDVYQATGAWTVGTATWTTSSGITGTGTPLASGSAINTAGTKINIALTDYSAIQGWINNSASNYGFGIKTTASSANSAVFLRSSDHGTLADRPKLTVVYAAPAGNLPTFAVTLSPEGGSGGSTSVDATFGAAMPAATAPTRGGYTFGGYYTQINGGGTQYYNAVMASVNVWNITAATTLYAKWTTGSATTHTVTLNKDGGTGGTNSVLATTGSAMPTAIAPTKTGYTFGGYYAALNGVGTQYYTAAMASAANWDIAADTTLYAKWTINSYTITFDSAGGSAVTAITQNFGTAVTAPTAPTRSGYTFAGWSPALPATIPAANQTVTAQWTANSYTVTFDKQSGSGGSNSVSATFAASMPAATAPSRAGYSFGGYYSAVSGGGTQYYTAAMASAANWNIAAATTLYAQWTAVTTYTLTVTSGTGGGAYAAGSVVAISADAPLTNYRFVNWTASGGGSFADANASSTTYTMPSNNASVTANYALNNAPVVDAGTAQTLKLEGNAAWTPAQMATVAWYDAADATTISASAGRVSGWNDKSGNNNHLTQATGTRQPFTGTDTYNGKNVLTFNAPTAPHCLSTTNKASWDNVFIVCDYDDMAFGARPTVLGGKVDANYVIQFDNDNPQDSTPDSFLGSDFYLNGASTMAAGTDAALVQNPTLIRKAFAFSNKDLSIGSDREMANRSWDGQFAEVIYVNGSSAEDLQKVEGYLAHKWGLTANLPADHPYKDTAPGAPAVVANLDGTATDADSDALTTSWTKVSGPNSISFGNTAATATTATFTEAGTYTLRLTANDGFGPASDDVVITINPPGSIFSITYNGNGNTGGSVPIDSSSPYASGIPVTVIGNTGSLSITGQSFASWNTAANGSGTNYVAGNTFTITADTTLYAQWALNSYTVTFDKQSGTGGSNSVNATYTSSMPAATAPSRAGYTFGGYYTAVSGGGTQYYTAAMASATNWNIAANTTLYAKWTNNAPTWASDPITGTSATEDSAYSATLVGSASDIDAGASLIFAKVSGPAWLSVAANGALSGTPTNSDVGSNSFTVSVNDGISAAVQATLNITVGNANDAPTWTANPITGANATRDTAYTGSLAGSATDVDAGAALTFAKVSGPAWLGVAANGALSGTPSSGDVGANSFTVSVSDGIATAVQATLNITVVNSNVAPTWVSNPITGTNATEDSAYSATLAGSASDGDAGASLVFAKVSGPAWLSVAANGALSGTPTNSDVGTNGFTVSVSDGIAAAVQATLNITVINTNDAPTWVANPVAGAAATPGLAYTGSLASSATDVDAGAALTFAKVSGPAWLTVGTNGALSGTPVSGDGGANSFTVSVSDGIATAVQATLTITVNLSAVTWDTDAAGNWTDITKWLGDVTYASGTNSTATFGNFITANRIITLDAPITIGNIIASDTTHNYTISGANILTLDRTSGIPTVDVTSSRTLTIGSEIAGLDGLQKIGLGTLTLTGANSYTGDTTITNGTLSLGGATATGSLASTVLNLAGGTLSYTRTGTNAQYFAATNIKPGASTASTTVATNTLNLGDLTRDVGGTLNFGNVGSIITSETNNGSGIIGGWATFNNANWAVANGASAITGAPTYYTTVTGGTTGANYTNAENMDVSASVTMDATINPNTVRFNVLGASTVTLATGDNIIASGGILVTSTVGNNASAITGGNLAGSSGGDLIVHQHNTTGTSSTLTIGSIIKDNGTATGLTKSGAGTLSLSGNNTYTGITTINAGFVEISHANALGTTAGNTIIAGTGQLKILRNINDNNIGIISPENITITGSGTAIFNNSGKSSTLSGNITLDNPSGNITFSTANGGSKIIFSGTITQLGTSRDLNATSPTSGGQGITFNNPIANNSGRLVIGGGSAIDLKGVNATDGTGIGETVISTGGNLRLGVSEALNITANLTADGTLNINNFNQTVNALTGTSTGVVNNGVAGTRTLTVGNGGGSGSFSGAIQTGTGQVFLVKTGIGTQTLSGTNTSTGGTRIDAGTLTLGHSTNTLADTGAVNVNSGTLDLDANTDTVGAVTLTSGSITGTTGVLTGSSYALESGSVSAILAGAAVGLTKTTAGTVTLSGDNTYTGTTNVNDGTLLVNGNQSTASGDVTVAVNATLGGTGTLGGNTTIAIGGKLEFNLSTVAASHNPLELVTGKGLAFSGASTLTITSTGGASPGIYTLITGGNSIGGATLPTLNLPVGWSATVSISGNNLLLDVTSTATTYTVTYNGNSHTSGTAPSNQTKNHDVSLTLANNNSGNLVRTGYTFIGWNTQTDGLGINYAVDSAYTANASVTLYAKWITVFESWSGGSGFSTDSNGDGTHDGMAWLLGAVNKDANAVSRLPAASSSAGNLQVSFTCLKVANRGSATLKLQVSDDLGVNDPWTSQEAVVPDASGTVNGVVFTITANADPNLINVQASIPGATGKVFARLLGTP